MDKVKYQYSFFSYPCMLHQLRKLYCLFQSLSLLPLVIVIPNFLWVFRRHEISFDS